VGTIRDPRTGEVVAAPRGNRRGTFVDVDTILRTGRSWRDLEEARAAAEAATKGRGRRANGEQADTLSIGAPEGRGENTTIAVVATNATLTKALANRLAEVCHDAFARTTWPAHTRGDGDAIFALATGAVETDASAYSALEAMATLALERAILRGVRAATGLAGTPSVTEWQSRRRPTRR
jgi:L-aminopeptidase/D-esterase-like protein